MHKNLVRALRLPFVSASILPFLFGSFIRRENFNLLGFLFGLIAAVATHLSANLINDYADSKSGADWQDCRFYTFFGGSKLIQEKVYSQNFYLVAAITAAACSALAVVALALVLKSLSVIGFYLAIILLSWSYSEKPLQFSYRRLGELIIFILFGPALVMGAYFIQTGVFPDMRSFVLSLPFGFFTTSILFANEVPDFTGDKQAGKMTWVSLVGQKKAFVLYYVLIFFGFASIFLAVLLGYLSWDALFSLIFIIPAFKAANILRQFPGDKLKLMQSSQLTITIQAWVGIVLIIGILI